MQLQLFILNAIKNGKSEDVVYRIGKADLLVIDNLEYICGMEATQEEIGKIHAAEQEANRRHQDVIDEWRDDLAKGSTDEDTDGHVQDIAAHNEFLEFLNHENPPHKMT